MQVYMCQCGKICTSKAGYSLHGVRCKKYQANEEHKCIELTDNEELLPEAKKIFDLVQIMAFDATRAICNHNKSAGRRARLDLVRIRSLITPLRKKILDSMKNGKQGI